MKEVVERLWELQKVMTDLQDKQNRLENKPEGFAAIDQEYQSATAEIERLQGRAEELQVTRREIERELQSEQEVLKKYQGQLMQVKNQQQYAAAWKEIDTSRKKISEIEEQLLGVMSEIEQVETDLGERQEAYGSLKETYEREYGIWQSSLDGLRSEIAQIRGRAESIEQALPRALRSEFHQIFDRRQGVAVALVENGACSACRVRVRPQVDQLLKRGELARCEGCRRIYYLERVAS